MALSRQSVRRRTGTAERVSVAHQHVTSAKDSGRYPALTSDAVDHQGAVLLEQVGILNVKAAQANQLSAGRLDRNDHEPALRRGFGVDDVESGRLEL